MIVRIECASCCASTVAHPSHFSTSIRSSGEREWACPECGNATPAAVVSVLEPVHVRSSGMIPRHPHGCDCSECRRAGALRAAANAFGDE